MKIVINNCFGGFSLSPLGLKRWAELNGLECHFYKGGISDQYEKIEEPDNNFFWTAATTSDVAVLNKYKAVTDKWHQMNEVEKDEHNRTYDNLYLSSRNIERTDRSLIRTIEELGEIANGRCANLKVVEIPDDVDWELQEYDGNEWIAEKHRTWS